MHNTPGSNRWVSGRVIARKRPVSYEIELLNGRITRRHIDHLKLRHEKIQPEVEQDMDTLPSAEEEPPEKRTSRWTNRNPTSR